MGHATHFLRRVERLSSLHADLALTLYRDPALIRIVLSQASLPEGAERVALALEHKPDGPHIIVSRDGYFITCLGAGMGIGATPRISRSAIDQFSGSIQELRAALAATELKQGAELARLVRVLLDGGNTMSREDFGELSMLMPLFARDLLKIAMEEYQVAEQFRDRYSRGRYRHAADKSSHELRRYWVARWMVTHTTALYGSREQEIAHITNLVRNSDARRRVIDTVMWSSTQSLSVPALLRAAWVAARVGPRLTPQLGQALHQCDGYLEFYLRSLGLLAIGLRHADARAEVHDWIQRYQRPSEDPSWGPNPLERLDEFRQMATFVFENEAELRMEHRRAAAESLANASRRLPEGHPARYATPEEVPDELAMALPLCLDDVVIRNKGLHNVIVFLPWVACAEAHELYWPAAMIKALIPEWQPAVTTNELNLFNDYFRRHQPVRKDIKPGRNQPCACGSGKKYKRCCEAS